MQALFLPSVQQQFQLEDGPVEDVEFEESDSDGLFPESECEIFQESDGSQRQTQEINFHLAANWRLFHLKASGATRLEVLHHSDGKVDFSCNSFIIL